MTCSQRIRDPLPDGTSGATVGTSATHVGEGGFGGGGESGVVRDAGLLRGVLSTKQECTNFAGVKVYHFAVKS